jgi:hypothetical protein
MQELMYSHHDGEVWGLCTVKDSLHFYTSGDDNKIIHYDIESRVNEIIGSVIKEDPKAA